MDADDMVMMEENGEHAYNSYVAAGNGFSTETGKLLPSWKELTESQQEVWASVATNVESHFMKMFIKKLKA